MLGLPINLNLHGLQAPDIPDRGLQHILTFPSPVMGRQSDVAVWVGEGERVSCDSKLERVVVGDMRSHRT